MEKWQNGKMKFNDRINKNRFDIIIMLSDNNKHTYNVYVYK